MLYCVSIFYFFLLLNSIPLYGYSTICCALTLMAIKWSALSGVLGSFSYKLKTRYSVCLRVSPLILGSALLQADIIIYPKGLTQHAVQLSVAMSSPSSTSS